MSFIFLKKEDNNVPMVDKTAGAVQHDTHMFAGSSISSSGSVQAEEIYCNGSKKLKKKHKKYQSRSVYFGPNKLLRASLSQHKKRTKRKNHVVKEDHGSNDLGPSTSKLRDPVAEVKRRRVKSCLNKVDKRAKKEEMNSNGGLLIDSVNTDMKLIEKLKDCKNDSMENGLMSMLTRGLEETIGECVPYLYDHSQTVAGMFWSNCCICLSNWR